MRLVPAGERASVCGVSPAKNTKVSGSDRARDEAIQQRPLSGRLSFHKAAIFVFCCCCFAVVASALHKSVSFFVSFCRQ